MRALPAALLLLLLPPGLAAQTCYGVADLDPTTGGANVIPFGNISPTDPTWSNQRYQALILASDMQNTPGLIREIFFACAGTGVRHFDTIQVRLAHFSGATLSTTFDANLSSPVTVLESTDYRWYNEMSTWSALGFQQSFPYNGTDNVVIDVLVTGAGMPVVSAGSRGFRTSARPRLYAFTWAGTPPPTGTLGTTSALKMRVCTEVADIWLYGEGCQGSNLQTPALSFTGTAQIGTVFSADLSDAPATLPVLLPLGFSNSLLGGLVPLPLDLGPLGAPDCSLYVDVVTVSASVTNASGQAQVRFSIPLDRLLIGGRAWLQYLPLDGAANTLGLTASNYGRIHIGL